MNKSSSSDSLADDSDGCQITDQKNAYKIGDTCRDRRYDTEEFVCCDEKTQKCKDKPCWVAGSQCKNKKPSGQRYSTAHIQNQENNSTIITAQTKKKLIGY